MKNQSITISSGNTHDSVMEDMIQKRDSEINPNYALEKIKGNFISLVLYQRPVNHSLLF
jgi:hypothetical protein